MPKSIKEHTKNKTGLKASELVRYGFISRNVSQRQNCRAAIGPDTMTSQLRYRRHRSSLARIASCVDLKPATINSVIFLKPNKLISDYETKTFSDQGNIHLLRRINRIHRITGATKNYNEHDYMYQKNFFMVNERLDNIQRENIRLGCRLLTVKSSMHTRRGLEEMRAKMKRQHKYMVPLNVIDRYRIMVPRDMILLRKLLRPKIFLDLEVRNIRPLGRLTIQFFTEACPELVLEFVRICTIKNLHYFNFIRIFPGLWIEGELNVDERTLTHKNFEYQTDVIDHGISAGVFSFARCYLHGFPPGLINFSISFKALPVLKGDRIPFAIVTHGLRVLDCLQDYGTKNGKTTKQIVVVNCGMLN